MVTSANVDEGENRLHAELDCDSDVTRESVNDSWVMQKERKAWAKSSWGMSLADVRR